ncbi:MAG: acyl-CoA dehydratase activase [Spirochaetota bacterium]|nr:acyl-CoA dehydratase activase [Spirochaetota bacterium]
MITVGIDVGSITTKAAVIRDGEILSTKVIMTGYNAQKAGENVCEGILSELEFQSSSIECVVATGYGRNSVTFSERVVTEITCHATGAHYLNPKIRTIIDIGGQDSKAMIIDARGSVKDFVMNDKCAAGSGRFLEVIARALEVDLKDFCDLSILADNPAAISNICTVFAESEVISFLSKGAQREDIIAGIHESVAARIASMANRIGLKAPIMMTGGVAKNKGLVKAVENKIGESIEVSKYAQVTGAIGVALIGMISK